MGFEPWRPKSWHASSADCKPADEDVIRTLAEIEKASTPLPSATSDNPFQAQARPNSPAAVNAAWRTVAVAIGAAAGVAILGLTFMDRPPFGETRRGSGRVGAKTCLGQARPEGARQWM